MRRQRGADRRPTVVSDPDTLRPMPFGTSRAGTIENPVLEPVWGGVRVLVHVSKGKVVVRDPDGEELAVHDSLRRGLAVAVQADELVVDGHLVPAPLRDTTGVRLVSGFDAVKTVGAMGRHFFLGGLARGRQEAPAAAISDTAEFSIEGPTTFIAVDLLWLDGESLLDVPLLERKRILESVLDDGELVRKTVAVRPPVETWYAQWYSLGFREVAVKGANSRYTPGEPSPEWAITLIRRR